MGYIFQKDGECYVCGKHSDFFCDACEKYICDDHKKKKKLMKYDKKKLTVCPDCYSKKKPAKMAYRRYVNKDFIDL